MKPSKGEQTKLLLIETAAELFLKNGYSKTGINDILKQTNTTKGSFYFYFSSKKDLGLEVADYYGNVILRNWLIPLSSKPWNIFINRMITDIKKAVSEGKYFGCPIAILGLELAFVQDDLTNAYAIGMRKLINVFSSSLQVSGLSKNVADITAKKAFAIYEGYIIYYRISKDESGFDYMLKDLLSLINKTSKEDTKK
ncbi:TetR/AcrR family transcriptional regulator [Anaerosacchariphilus polymeriproducens]|uniref:TetR/AcrR family transcriptional regulator n=1 Tax=Anaerosacchariphilus polymeriproducens TaxID=1812858 RepID=A0A371AUU2_9FIRM|nr:TetR/AcrR family transcriptional regulator [Anaerosacchariphilus polymeriproducens]RDU23344.1 TetR/AcrR family transcriptional regulator [Anaerosacchariphilus polymeriproducens]